MADHVVHQPDAPALAPALDDLDEARRQLVAADLVGADQERLREQVLAFCADHADALHRRCLSGHLTGSALIVDPASARTLLINHVKLRRWLQPGGHADGDGNLGGVSWREATEETGLVGLRLVTPAIDLDVHTIPARPNEPEHLHLDLRHVVLAGPDLRLAPNHETSGARWLPFDSPELDGELARAVRRAGEVAATLR